MDQIVSKAGIHSIGPRRDGYGDFLRTIKASGRQLAGVKVRDDLGGVDEAVMLWPEIPTVGTMTIWDGAAWNVDEAVSRIVLMARSHPNIAYWEYTNERGDYDAQADFYIALMPRLFDAGVSLCMFNCASGNPPYLSEDGGAAYAAIARACKFAKDNHFDTILGLHEYVSTGGTIGRFKMVADYLEAHNALIPIAITEWLFETYPGDGKFMAALQENDKVYIADDRVLFCATWTLGGGGWQGSNFSKSLPHMAQYTSTVTPIEPPPPVGDAKYDVTLPVVFAPTWEQYARSYLDTHNGSMVRE